MDISAWGAAEFAAAASYFTILVGGGIAAAQLRHIRRVQREQTRPYVIVDFEFRSFLVYLVIQNTGTTMAKEVKITFEPALSSSLQTSRYFEESPLFREPIPMLAPGRRVSVLLDSYVDRAKRTDLPMEHYVHVEYYDSAGQLHVDPEYPLDLGMYEGSALPPKGTAELVQEVHELRRELAKWTDGIRGIRVHSVDRDKRELRRNRPSLRGIAVRIRKDDGLVAYGRWLVGRQLRRYGWRR